MKLVPLFLYLIIWIIEYWHLIVLAILTIFGFVFFAILVGPKLPVFLGGDPKPSSIPYNYNQSVQPEKTLSDQHVESGYVKNNHGRFIPRTVAQERCSYLPKQFVVFDLETTGLDSATCQIIEIGAIRVNRDSIEHETFEKLIKYPKKLPKKIVELTGITDNLLINEGVSLENAIIEFSHFAGGLPLVSFNTDFDLSFLYKAASQHGANFSRSTSCALKMAKRAWPGLKSYRLLDLAQMGGFPLSNPHRALGDCERALYVYLAAANTLKSA